MIGEYNCPYPYYSGKLCNKSCIRPEGCSLHWKIKRPLCIKCGKKPTKSESKRCRDCIGGYYIVKYYKKLRLQASLIPVNEN